MTGFRKPVRDIITRRSQGVCERCGVNPAVQIHHRRPRAMGGTRRPDTNLPANGLHVCPACHCAIESDREEALRHGWLVLQRHEPFLVPVFRRGEWVSLYDDGSIEMRTERNG